MKHDPLRLSIEHHRAWVDVELDIPFDQSVRTIRLHLSHIREIARQNTFPDTLTWIRCILT